MPSSQPRVALIVIATGERYWPYVRPLLESAYKYFLPHSAFLFTDNPELLSAFQIQIPALGYPLQTLQRYHTILDHAWIFEEYDYIFYVDVDALFVDYVGDEILADGITATQHAGFKPPNGAWEHRPESSAWVPFGKRKVYFAGGFNGGTRKAYLEMAQRIRNGVDMDTRNGIMAIWHDESHVNRYLYYYEPAKVLSPAYCYPEPQYLNGPSEILKGIEPKILCLEKALR